MQNGEKGNESVNQTMMVVIAIAIMVGLVALLSHFDKPVFPRLFHAIFG